MYEKIGETTLYVQAAGPILSTWRRSLGGIPHARPRNYLSKRARALVLTT